MSGGVVKFQTFQYASFSSSFLSMVCSIPSDVSLISMEQKEHDTSAETYTQLHYVHTYMHVGDTLDLVVGLNIRPTFMFN